jgi:hypothetical protein
LQRRKDELHALKEEEDRLRAAAGERGRSLEQQVEDSRVRLEELEMERKVLGSVIKGTKEDNLVYQNRLNLLEQQVRRARLALQAAREGLAKSASKRTQALKLQAQFQEELARLKAEREQQFEFKEHAREEFKGLK